MPRTEVIRVMVLPSEKLAFKEIVDREGTTMSDSLRLTIVEKIRQAKEVDR